jgi:hypothetical protein
VTGYGLNVGTSPGAADLVNIGPLSGTSATVTLPTNGAPIYVRLWTIFNGTTYFYNDYTYTEFTQSAAAITSPSRQHVDLGFNHLHLERRPLERRATASTLAHRPAAPIWSTSVLCPAPARP